MWEPLCLAIIFGLTVSTATSLVITPIPDTDAARGILAA